MALVSLVRIDVGQVKVLPGTVKMVTTDNLATITAANYLAPNGNLVKDIALSPNDVIECLYSYNKITNVGTLAYFTPAIANGVITLTQWIDPANVLLPVTANHIASFNGTTGQIKADANPAINGGDIQAGLSGTAGKLISFPGTAAKGSFIFQAANNTGNTNTTITNAAMGQATVLTVPDPAQATANMVVAPNALVSGNILKASGTAGLVADAGFAVKANTTAAYAGGGTSNAFVATGLTASSIVTAVILTQTNAATIVKAVPSANTLTVTFSVDPGANTTVSWIAITPAV